VDILGLMREGVKIGLVDLRGTFRGSYVIWLYNFLGYG